MVSNPRLIPFAIASSTGELADANQIVVSNSGLAGIIQGSLHVQTALARIDATGLGAPIFTFVGDYSAQNSNINEWFNGQANRHLQGAAGQVNGLRTFTLPGSTVLGTIFDQLTTAGLPELYRLTISYLGGVAGTVVTSNRLNIVPRVSPAPQIDGRTSVMLAHGDTVTLEITRTSGVISDYVVISEGRLQGGSGGDSLDDIELQSITWDASASGPLPTGVLKGYAYRVVNAPADGSGRFGVVMQSDDWVVWFADTFTQWSDVNNWFVIAAGDVRRITLAGQQFLEDVGTRTETIRGVAFNTSPQDISHWFRIYDTTADYSAADLNASTDEGSITTTTNRDGARLAIRFGATNATIATLLTTLDAYEEDTFGNFNLIGNLSTDFTFEGDFGSESDYVASRDFDYSAGSVVRLYIQTTRTLNTISDYNALDNVENGTIEEVKLASELRRRIGSATSVPNLQLDEQRISALESKMTALFPLSPDVHKLTDWADIYDPEASAATVTIAPGYSNIVDYRGGGTRYQQAGVQYSIPVAGTVRYEGLGTSEFRSYGFRVSGAADETLMSLRDSTETIPFISITAAGRIRINNYTPATTQAETQTNVYARLTLTSGTQVITTASGSLATFTATRFPASATNTSRVMELDLEALVNGVDTQASGFVTFSLPATNVAQARQTVDHTINLGPLHQNRQVPVTIGYATRVSGDDLLVDITLVAAPSDVTIRLQDVGDFRTFTAPATVARVDNWVNFADENGDYTLSGDTDFLITFQPHASARTTEAVAVARTAAGVSTQFNDIAVPIGTANFDSVEIQSLGSLPGSEFKCFTPVHYLVHSDVAQLLTNARQQWCYGLAANSAQTEHAVSAAVDFTQGIVLTSPDASRWSVTIDDTGAIQTAKLP